MNYSLLLYQAPADFEARKAPEKFREFWDSFGPCMTAVQAAGIFVHGDGLQPPETATTVRRKHGASHVQDGPFADTKEQLGGMITLNVSTLDAALQWASRCPVTLVEVRPTVPPHA